MNKQTQIKVWYRKELCDKFDWRIKHIWNLESELEKVPGNNNTYDWEVGSVFFWTQAFLYSKQKIDLVIPDMTAIYLNISQKNYQLSKEYLAHLKKEENGYIHLETQAFDYLEYITVSIVFSISALEVFFNQLLLWKDKNVSLLTATKKDWTSKDFKRDDIEWLSIEEKYLKVLPLMFQIWEKKLDKIQSKLKLLNKLRNDIIHLKSKDLESNTDINQQTTIWKRLFDQSKNNPANISIEIIKFYYETSWKELPRFLRLLPFKK